MLLKLSPVIVLALLGVVLVLRAAEVIDANAASLLSLALATFAVAFGLYRSYRRKRESK